MVALESKSSAVNAKQVPVPLGGMPPHNISEKMTEVRQQQSEGAKVEEEMLIEEAEDIDRTRGMWIDTVGVIASLHFHLVARYAMIISSALSTSPLIVL